MIPLRAALEQVAWADNLFFAFLEALPDDAWLARAAEDEWDVARLTFHLVASADWFAFELGQPIRFTEEPGSLDAVRALRPVWREIDAFFVEQSDLGDELLKYEEDGESFEVLRSTVLTEVILHAVEHRTQIVAALKAGGFPSPELQDFSVWPYAEGTSSK